MANLDVLLHGGPLPDVETLRKLEFGLRGVGLLFTLDQLKEPEMGASG